MDGIVLLAKQPGDTSFSSLFNVKKALNTTKVGHTGTLDSFAQGLLVVCVGRLTKLAGNITEFNKSYSAIIKFGEETDTLEYTGQVIKKAELPTLDDLKNILKKYSGELDQIPPAYSAIHVDGKRASDLIRAGKSVEIKSRKIYIFKNELVEYKLNNQNLVEYCRINFTVSKGTYIRSLARDIAKDLNSAGHLIGLYRTSVGNFSIENACGFNSMQNFSIESAIQTAEKFKNSNVKQIDEEYKKEIQNQIKENILPFSKNCAELCGFTSVVIYKNFEFSFKNGKPILNEWFYQKMIHISENEKIAVFTENEEFLGLINRKDKKHLSYLFVIN